jgi:DNA (cytosine-5)-methyltransferase 1
MLHLGDITKINGADVPMVNVIIGGSPCQDLSVAGKRAGLSGERSGLFIEQLRIIKEMRRKDIDNGAVAPRPRYMVWENVSGAFSSNKGEDFRIVLEETAKVVEPTAAIPRPDKGKWTNAGAVMGDGWSIAWRVFDAQFWGVPQRRRRIALVADFGGRTAPEILFERKGVSRYSPPGETSWENFAAAVAERFGKSNKSASIGNGLAYCIQGNCIDRAGTAGCNGKGWTEDVSYTLNTVDRPAAYDARGNGDGETVPAITYDHENRVTDYTALCVCERCGCEGGGKGVLIQNNKSGTLAANNDQFILHPIVCMATQQGGAEIRTDDKSPTLTAAAGMSGNNQPVIAIDRAAFNQGKNALYEPKISEDGINSTLTAKGPSAICQNTVRRLTPLECERLQGFPDGWTDIGDYIDTKGKKRKTSDSARYKALGNSIALPSWVWVLERLACCCGSDYTMASLFDGIGGFPLIWETLNGEGTCLWASEIDEFPIAVTKRHFS